MVALAYVLGMRIELDDECVTKVYFFGLFRNSIRRSQLRVSISSSYRGGKEADFESADGKGLGFTLVRSAWRGRDFYRLCAIAAGGEEGQTAKPVATSDRVLATTDAGFIPRTWTEAEREAKNSARETPNLYDDPHRPVRADESQTTDAFIDDGFFILLSASLGLLILIGAAIGIQLHSWRSLLAFVASFTCIIPAAPYLAFGNRLPTNRLILWPVRTVVFVLTVGIPLTIWILLIGQGGLAHEVLKFLGCLITRATCRG